MLELVFAGLLADPVWATGHNKVNCGVMALNVRSVDVVVIIWQTVVLLLAECAYGSCPAEDLVRDLWPGARTVQLPGERA